MFKSISRIICPVIAFYNQLVDKRIKTEMFFKLSYLNSNLGLTLGYLNPALNNSAQSLQILYCCPIEKSFRVENTRCVDLCIQTVFPTRLMFPRLSLLLQFQLLLLVKITIHQCKMYKIQKKMQTTRNLQHSLWLTRFLSLGTRDKSENV